MDTQSFSRTKINIALRHHLTLNFKLAFQIADKDVTQVIFVLISYLQVMVFAFCMIRVRNLMIPFLQSGLQMLAQLPH